MADYNSFLGGMKPDDNSGTFPVNNDFDGTQTLSAIGFTDVAGGVYSILGGAIVGATTGATDWQTKPILRGSSEDSTDDTVTAYIGAASANVAVISRLQRGGSNDHCYFGEFTSGELVIAARIGSGLTVLASGAPGGIVLPAGHDYRLDMWTRPNASTGTDISLTVCDATAQTYLGRLDVVGDATASLQAAGGVGCLGWAGNYYITQFRHLAGASPVISRIKGKLLACVGNSRTYGYQTTSPYQIDFPYPVQLASLLGDGWTVLNYGFDGQDGDAIGGYVPTHDIGLGAPFIERVVGTGAGGLAVKVNASLNKLDYSDCLIVYMEHINWIAHSSDDFNSWTVPYPSGESDADMVLRLQQLSVDFRTAGWSEFYVCTEPATLTPTLTDWAPEYIARRLDINSLLAAEHSWADGLIDVAAARVSGVAVFDETQTTNLTYYQSDTTHLTDAGSGVVAAAVFAFLSGLPVPAYDWFVVEEGGGLIDGYGHYTAPEIAGTYHVVAVQIANPTQVGVAVVTVT
jgi:hypothetical protein